MRDENGQFFLEAKKSLGQHFLRSKKALEIMANCGGEPVFEIGPGEGVLTEKLLQKGFTVIVIEIDKRSIGLLKEKFAKEIQNKKLFLIEKNCLEVDYAKTLKSLRIHKEYTLIGNIPYYITGAIFRHTFEQKLLPKQVTFLIQKEVAQRVVANDKKESLLSVSVKIYSENVKILDIVKAGSFVPPPKVDSAIITIKDVINPFESLEKRDIFFKILKACFSHKRKLLLTNLKTDLDESLFGLYFEIIKKIIITKCTEKTRAEDVEIDIWKEIIKII